MEFQLGEKKNKESRSALRVATVFRKSHYDRSPHRLAEICSRRSNEEGIENIGRLREKNTAMDFVTVEVVPTVIRYVKRLRLFCKLRPSHHGHIKSLFINTATVVCSIYSWRNGRYPQLLDRSAILITCARQAWANKLSRNEARVSCFCEQHERWERGGKATPHVIGSLPLVTTRQPSAVDGSNQWQGCWRVEQ